MQENIQYLPMGRMSVGAGNIEKDNLPVLVPERTEMLTERLIGSSASICLDRGSAS